MLPLKVYWLCGFPLLKKWDWGVEVLNMARVFFFFFGAKESQAQDMARV